MIPSGPGRGLLRLAVLAALAGVFGCNRAAAPGGQSSSAPARPSILLVTLDTTRADAIGPEARGIATPSFNALAARGVRFRQAYAAVPETLPSHATMLTGLYPAGHGVHENARFLSADRPLAPERLKQAGYRTAAFVSSFVLAKRFGLSRGFDVYDDELDAGRAERPSSQTTDRALAYLAQPSDQPLLLWVHYFDPHTPYDPPEPFRSRFPGRPYLGEVAAMDEQLGRLVQGFERHARGPLAIVVASDHGEGLGDHGEPQHGTLLYQPTMLVPLVLVAPELPAGVSDSPVSTRRIFHTLLDLAGLGSADSLRGGKPEIVLGEAMKPFLSYGWQPQTMAVEGRRKSIYAGKLEVYDVVADPAETRDVAAASGLSPEVRKALEDYPVPVPGAAPAGAGLNDEARRQLATLGYVSATAPPAVREDAPRPVEMAHIFEAIEKASGLFVREQYAEAIPLLETIIAADPHNLDAVLRLATAHSSLGHEARAIAAFRQAEAIAPRSPDVSTYLALHYARGREWERAAPMLERIVAETPGKLPAVEALASIRERQGRMEEAVALRQKVYGLRPPTAAELIRLGGIAMAARQTPAAIDAFEKARGMTASGFAHDLELGVLYLDARRLPEARDALDRVPASHPEYPMALFKRAQVSVLLNEPDRTARIERARRGADGTTRELIARERLFQAVR